MELDLVQDDSHAQLLTYLNLSLLADLNDEEDKGVLECFTFGTALRIVFLLVLFNDILYIFVEYLDDLLMRVARFKAHNLLLVHLHKALLAADVLIGLLL